MNGDVTVKNKDGGMIVRIPYTTIKKVKLANSKPEEPTKEVIKPSDTPQVEVPKSTPAKK